MGSITGSTGAGIAVATAAAADLKVGAPGARRQGPGRGVRRRGDAGTIDGIRDGGFFNAGQDRTAATRVLCQEGIYDEFVAELAKSAAGVETSADASTDDPFYGPINNANQLKHISGLVSRAPRPCRRGGQRWQTDRRARLLRRGHGGGRPPAYRRVVII